MTKTIEIEYDDLSILRNCHVKARQDPNAPFFAENEGSFEICLKGKGSFIAWIFSDIKEDSDDGSFFTMTECTYKIDGNVYKFPSAENCLNFFENNFNDIYDHNIKFSLNYSLAEVNESEFHQYQSLLQNTESSCHNLMTGENHEIFHGEL